MVWSLGAAFADERTMTGCATERKMRETWATAMTRCLRDRQSPPTESRDARPYLINKTEKEDNQKSTLADLGKGPRNKKNTAIGDVLKPAVEIKGSREDTKKFSAQPMEISHKKER